MEDLSDNEETVLKPKTRSPAQIEAFKKAQQVRLENAKLKQKKLDDLKETIKIEVGLSPEEKEEHGLIKLQQERDEIEKKIIEKAKAVQDKKDILAAERKARKEELREKEELKALKTKLDTKKKKKEPTVIYESESEEEVVIVKKKKKAPKIIYEEDSENEPELSKPKPKPKAPVVTPPVQQPQIIKTNQIRFF